MVMLQRRQAGQITVKPSLAAPTRTLQRAAWNLVMSLHVASVDPGGLVDALILADRGLQ